MVALGTLPKARQAVVFWSLRWNGSRHAVRGAARGDEGVRKRGYAVPGKGGRCRGIGGAGVAFGRAEASMAEKKVMGGRAAGVCGSQ